jgi:flagellar motor switch protein FliN/FliY
MSAEQHQRPTPPGGTPVPDAPPQSSGDMRLNLVLDVPLDVSVELGRARMPIRELLTLGPGSVVTLDKDAGEPLDIMVNGQLLARGEAVVINDRFGVRITDIVNPMERVARLR